MSEMLQTPPGAFQNHPLNSPGISQFPSFLDLMQACPSYQVCFFSLLLSFLLLAFCLFGPQESLTQPRSSSRTS